jgi:hypothetical protein
LNLGRPKRGRATRRASSAKIHGRVGEGELTTFAKQFGFDGYLKEVNDGKRMLDEIARDLFYLSLTGRHDASQLWGFGSVRLRLTVTPIQSRSDLRVMAYSPMEGVAEHPLALLRKVAQERFGRQFIPWRVSRAGAFYLPFFFDDESEVRLLIKRFGASNDLRIRKSAGHDAIAISLVEANERVSISVTEVQTQSPEVASHAQALLARVPHWQVGCSVCVP